MNLNEKKLTYQARKKLSSRSFAEPRERKYPIEDKAHARNALARVSAHGTPAEKARVRAAVHKKFPSIGKTTESLAKSIVNHLLESGESYYEVYVKPDSGPATVGERDVYGRHAWVSKEEAIDLAAKKKTYYPHMDFIVHEVSPSGSRKKVYDTKTDGQK